MDWLLTAGIALVTSLLAVFGVSWFMGRFKKEGSDPAKPQPVIDFAEALAAADAVRRAREAEVRASAEKEAAFIAAEDARLKEAVKDHLVKQLETDPVARANARLKKEST
jgi:hypothetical protein